MTVQLKKLYEYVTQGDMRLIGGQKGINNGVCWIHMVESLELSTFLSGREIAFITGIGLKPPVAESLIDLVKGIYENHSSAVIINVGPYIENIPQEVIDFCDDHDFPLFEVPWRVHLAEIMHLFSTKLMEAEKTDTELGSALKHAIYTPKQEELYLPTFNSNGFSDFTAYCVSMVEITDEKGISIKNDVSLMDQIKIHIEDMLSCLKNSGFALVFQDRLVCVFTDCDMSTIKKIMAQVRRYDLLPLPSKYQYRIGIGGMVFALTELYKSYAQVRKILKLQKKQNSNELCVYDELGVYSLLFAIEDRDVMLNYYKNQLEPITNIDELNGTNYTEVLQVYLDTNCSVNKTAEFLYVHRNTVNYKLKKIENILSCDLSSFKDRFKLELALMIHHLLK